MTIGGSSRSAALADPARGRGRARRRAIRTWAGICRREDRDATTCLRVYPNLWKIWLSRSHPRREFLQQRELWIEFIQKSFSALFQRFRAMYAFPIQGVLHVLISCSYVTSRSGRLMNYIKLNKPYISISVLAGIPSQNRRSISHYREPKKNYGQFNPLGKVQWTRLLCRFRTGIW